MLNGSIILMHRQIWIMEYCSMVGNCLFYSIIYFIFLLRRCFKYPKASLVLTVLLVLPVNKIISIDFPVFACVCMFVHVYLSGLGSLAVNCTSFTFPECSKLVTSPIYIMSCYTGIHIIKLSWLLHVWTAEYKDLLLP